MCACTESNKHSLMLNIAIKPYKTTKSIPVGVSVSAPFGLKQEWNPTSLVLHIRNSLVPRQRCCTRDCSFKSHSLPRHKTYDSKKKMMGCNLQESLVFLCLGNSCIKFYFGICRGVWIVGTMFSCNMHKKNIHSSWLVVYLPL